MRWLTALSCSALDRYPSGQRGLTVNQLALPSEVRILPGPPISMATSPEVPESRARSTRSWGVMVALAALVLPEFARLSRSALGPPSERTVHESKRFLSGAWSGGFEQKSNCSPFSLRLSE